MQQTPRPWFSFHFYSYCPILGCSDFHGAHCFTMTFHYSGTMPEDSTDAAQPEIELYEDLDFGDHSPIDYGYENEEMSEGDIADD